MIMIDQSRRLREPLRWGRRERTVVAALVSCAALALIGLGAYALTSGATAKKDCIDVTFASSVGAAELHGCGSQARRICASGGQYHSIETELNAACRRAGLPYGRTGPNPPIGG